MLNSVFLKGTLFELHPVGHRPATMRPATHRTFLVVLTGLLVLAAGSFAQARPASPTTGDDYRRDELAARSSKRLAGSASDVGADEVAAPIRSAFSCVSCKYEYAQLYGPFCSNRPVER